MSDHEENEIIFIRKRHGDEDEEHHGGVWKLAFADFMTAMMAFFLVMWLINSTSKEVKAAIVQYFNPVQLIDSNPARKGLRDPQEGGQGKSAQHSATEDRSSQSKDKEKDGPLHEAELFYDPIATLDQIASTSGSQSSSPAATKLGQEAPAFGDPFDRSARGGYIDERVEDSRSPDKSTPVEQPDEPPARVAQPAPSTAKSAVQQPRASSPLEDKPKPEASSAASMRPTLEKIMKSETAAARSAPQIDVADTPEGLLISLTDDVNFSMFAVGSVEPKPQLVRIIGQIGRVLSKQPGEIELRGHTDGRSYKSASYDNWRLSSDRANMAYYMLVRGGLAEKRVVKIAGYADRRLKNAKDPFSAVNRRIEILLRKGEH